MNGILLLNDMQKDFLLLRRMAALNPLCLMLHPVHFRRKERIDAIRGTRRHTGKDIVNSLIKIDFLHAQRHLSDSEGGSRPKELSRHLSVAIKEIWNDMATVTMRYGRSQNLIFF